MTQGHRHNPRSHSAPRIGPIPENLIDAVIDGEVDARASREILAAARRNPQQRREIQDTTDILKALRAPIAAPDFSGAVVAEAHRRRNYIPARVQRFVTRSRLAVAASLLLVLLSYVGASRTWPDAAIFNTASTPLNHIEQSLAIDAQRAASSFTQARIPLPTIGSLREVSTAYRTPPNRVNGPVFNTVAYDAQRTGFYAFPMPQPAIFTERHNNAYAPQILYVGSSASTQPQPREFNRDSKLP